MIIQDLFQSQVQSKGMTVISSTPPIYEAAVSTFHEDDQRKYGLRIFRDKEQIIFDLWVPVPGTNELQHREMLLPYKDVLGILIKNKLTNSLQLADLMYKTMSERTVEEWNKIVDKVNSKSSIII